MSKDFKEKVSSGIEEEVAIYVEPSKRAILSIALFIALFGCVFSFRAFNIALPKIIANWNAMDLYSLGASITSVAMMVSTIVVARISPRVGLKPTITFGLILLIICNMLTIIAPNMAIFILLRVLTGLGNGIVLGQMAASTNKIWPNSKRGTWIGILGVFQAAPSVIGPTVAGFLVDNYGWPSTFIAVSALQVVALIIFVSVCPKDTKDRFYKPSPFDIAGTISFSVLVTTLVLIASYGNKIGWTDMKIIIGYAIAIASLFALVISENKAEAVGTALLPWNLFKTDKNFVKIFTLAFAGVFLGMAHPVFLVLFLQKVAKTSATVSGIPFSMVSIASLIAAPIAARIFQKTGRSKGLMVITSAIMTLPILFYGLWIYPEIGQSSTSLMILYVTSFIYGLGGILTMTIPYNACSEYLPKESVGVASANVYMAVNLGGSVGLAILQAIYNAVSKSVGMNAAIKTVFICASVGGILAVSLSLSLKKPVVMDVTNKTDNVRC